MKSGTAIVVDRDSLVPVQPNLRYRFQFNPMLAGRDSHLDIKLLAVEYGNSTYGLSGNFDLCYAEEKISTFVHTDTDPRLNPDRCVRLLDDGRSGELTSPRE